jgi:hypothetical protein
MFKSISQKPFKHVIIVNKENAQSVDNFGGRKWGNVVIKIYFYITISAKSRPCPI